MPVARMAAVSAALALLVAAPAHAAPGDLDPTFGDRGVVTAAPGSAASLRALTLSGGAIVGAGDVTGACRTAALVRWTANGTPDAGFGTAGVSAPSLGTCDDDESTDSFLNAVAGGGAAGQLLAGGGITTSGAYGAYHFNALLEAQTAGGGLDDGFSGDGWMRDSFRESAITDVVRLPDGRIVTSGNSYGIGRYNWEVHRYLAGGARDGSFDDDGAATYPWIVDGHIERLNALAADGADGAVVAVGDSARHEGDDHRMGVAIGRVRADGSLDPAFGTGGRTRVEPAGEEMRGLDVVGTPDGGFVVAGAAWPEAGDDVADAAWLLLKFGADGQLDPTFGAGGRVDGPAGHARGIAVDGAGHLLVTGDAEGRLAVARYLVNGALDPSFGNGGIADTGATATGEDVLVQPDGNVVAGGTGQRNGRSVMTVVRLLGGDGPAGTGSADGEIVGGAPGGDGSPGNGGRPGGGSVESGPVPNQGGATGTGVAIRILNSRVTRRGVLVRVTWPRGTDGTARARLWTRNKGILLGQRTVRAPLGTTGRTFRVPLNRRAKRLLRGGVRLKVRATARVTGLPAR